MTSSNDHYSEREARENGDNFDDDDDEINAFIVRSGEGWKGGERLVSIRARDRQ